MDEKEAIRQTLIGNKDAYGHLVRSFHRQLYYYVVGKIPSETEAEDIVQRTFVTAYNKLDEYQSERSFLAWLRGIALNHCRENWRQYQRQAELKDRVLEIRRAELNLKFMDSAEPDPERVVALRTCLKELSEFEQRAVHLRFVEELPLDAIGAELNKNAEAVRLFLFRIRQRLGSCIRKRLTLKEATQ